MKQEFLDRIEVFLNRDENASLIDTPASDEQIKLAENELSVNLDKEYIDFIKKFGGAYAGLPIHAFDNGSSIGREDIIQLTKQFRTWFSDENIFPEIKSSYIISVDGSGNPITIDSTGKVFLIDIDVAEKSLLADSFEGLIENNFHEW